MNEQSKDEMNRYYTGLLEKHGANPEALGKGWHDSYQQREKFILIEGFGELENNGSILDVGCGKAHLLYELSQLLPESMVCGIDISAHGLLDAPKEIRQSLFRYRSQDPFPWGDLQFDLVISLGCLHNLRLFELKSALAEIERVGRKKYVMVESYRNETELFNLQCWALTAETFFDNAEWIWLYSHFGYQGDYEFIYFE